MRKIPHIPDKKENGGYFMVRKTAKLVAVPEPETDCTGCFCSDDRIGIWGQFFSWPILKAEWNVENKSQCHAGIWNVFGN